MRHRLPSIAVAMALLIAVTLAVAGCGDTDTDLDTTAPEPAETDLDSGLLLFVADGEDHARDGTTSKEGWEITFRHAWVTVANVTAYQTDPPYDVDEHGWDIPYDEVVALGGEHTVDLAAAASAPALIGEAPDAQTGHYNALSWDLVRASSGPSEGYSMLFAGTAEKDGEVVNFTLRFDREIAYQGGEYVGDVRKGILEADGEAEMEMTFHFDHFFGRADRDADDPMNIDALGFDPIAALAADGQVDANMDDLEELLDAEDFARLEGVLLHFGHVGEGHCLAQPID